MKSRTLLGACTGLVFAGLVGIAPIAQAEPPTAENPVFSKLSAVPATMWQTNDVVWSLAYSDGVVYVGGSFTTVRPPGAAPGVSEQPQSRLAAFDAQTGAFISSWRPSVTGGDVFALDVSPDGNRLYVGGSFNKVNNISRNKIAAFDISNPRAPSLLLPAQFKASTNGKINDIDSTNDTVWVGGTFSTAGGASRPLVASFAAATGLVTPFEVALTESTQPFYPTPFVVTLEQNSGRLYIGGMFNKLDGAASHGLAVVNAVTSIPDPDFDVPTIVPTSYVVAAQVTDGRLFVSGRDDKTGNTARLEGVMAMDATTGTVLWGSDNHRCLGDTFAVLVLDGVVWNGTHAHDCAPIGGHPEANPRWYAAVLGQKDDTGDPAHFYPQVSGSPSVPGSRNNVRALATDGEQLFVAGGWLKVNGVPQQNITRFVPRPASDIPGKVFVQAAPTSTGQALVSWTASTDRDNRTLTYEIFRRWDLSTPIATIQADSTFWSRPGLSIVDEGVSPGESVFYRVRVSDGETTALSNKSNTIVIPAAPANYREAVIADDPELYWRLDDAVGSGTVADGSGDGEHGTVFNSVLLNQPGALSTSPNNAAAFSGGHLSTGVARNNPSTYAMELWFKTTTLAGGKLIGFGNSASGTSSQYDRHVYMTNSGQVVFGVYVGGTVTISSTLAYNDGQWHHMAATQNADGMQLYVDGALVASNGQTDAESYTGYVRAGGDNLAGWPSEPTAHYFSGTLDEIAYYDHALRSDQVGQHYDLR